MKQNKKLNNLKSVSTGGNWKKVLLQIYRHAPYSYEESNETRFYEDFHPIAKRLKIKGNELMPAISFLRNNKLIEGENHSDRSKSVVPKWRTPILLTEKGFDVALKLENQLGNEKLQKWIVLFTGIATWTGVVLFVINLFHFKEIINLRIYIFGILGIIFIMYFDFFKEKWERFVFRKMGGIRTYKK